MISIWIITWEKVCSVLRFYLTSCILIICKTLIYQFSSHVHHMEKFQVVFLQGLRRQGRSLWEPHAGGKIFLWIYCRNSEVLKGGIADFEVGLRISGGYPYGIHNPPKKFQLRSPIVRKTPLFPLGKHHKRPLLGKHHKQPLSTRFLYILKQDNDFGTIQEWLDREIL